MTKVKQSKRFYVYCYLRDAARENLEILKSSSRDKMYARMEAMLLSALAMEAWLNHIGPVAVVGWRHIERSLSPEQKLHLIIECMPSHPALNRGERPFQTFSDMIKLRNLLAHGRTHQVCDVISDESWAQGEFPKAPELEIEKWFTDANAERFVTDMVAMIDDLWEHLPNKDSIARPGVFSSHEYTTGV